jgi:glycerol-3-phosphate acyltransferase PlsX
MVTLLLDCMGGDHSPKANVDGALRALAEQTDLAIVLVGEEKGIRDCLQKKTYDSARLSLVDAPEVIDCKEAPTLAVFHRKNSSLVRSLDLLKENKADGMVSLGNSGALLVGGVVKIGKIEGVLRPAFCPLVPTMNGSFCALCDSGASSAATPEEIAQYALMGSLYLQKAFQIAAPRVALLNLGTEEGKGDETHQQAYALLKNCPSITFLGNMEGRDFTSGSYDLVAADGFSGNILLKSTEGTGLALLKLLKKTFYKNVKTKMGALLLKKDIYGIKNLMDYNNYGGAVMLGLKKTMIKGHGGGDERHVYHSLLQAYALEKSHLSEAIRVSLSDLALAKK